MHGYQVLSLALAFVSVFVVFWANVGHAFFSSTTDAHRVLPIQQAPPDSTGSGFRLSAPFPQKLLKPPTLSLHPKPRYRYSGVSVDFNET